MFQVAKGFKVYPKYTRPGYKLRFFQSLKTQYLATDLKTCLLTTSLQNLSFYRIDPAKKMTFATLSLHGDCLH